LKNISSGKGVETTLQQDKEEGWPAAHPGSLPPFLSFLSLYISFSAGLSQALRELFSHHRATT